MIYDIFMYNGESEHLELRLSHHKDFVDKFILMEFDRTYTGIYKGFHKLRIPDSINIDVIRYSIPFTDENERGWIYEHKQRDQLFNITRNLDTNDTLIYTDCDEIIKNKDVVSKAAEYPIAALEMDLFFYYYNLRLKNQTQYHESYHLNPCFKNKFHMGKILKIGKVKDFQHAYHIREHEVWSPSNLVKDAGWHFSNLGSPDRIYSKFKAFSHFGDAGFTDITVDTIRKNKESMKDPLGREGTEYEIVEDKDLPKYLIDNKEKFNEHFIKVSC